ncbi:unnamed protein product [Durusdinium trenchii]|uniref:Transketolase-like pyrimidine-binding domain-containing protein n=2 Tax=Durusdinium trenchii TaxID=1381693 RepID=A0ABP0NY50_9DINO
MEAKTLTIEDLIFGGHKERKSQDEAVRKGDELVINCLRSLAMDAVQQANSGHPGTPMAMAPVAYALWARILSFDPEAPHWMNRDRFVLSMGHASMLLYGLLHLAGVKEVSNSDEVTGQLAVSLEDIKEFRQFSSKCPGHPEFGETTGVEVTTGPLAQGVATSVGMATASKWLGARFNKPEFKLFGFDVFALASDGDMQEGLSSEAASLAGHLKLSNLCWIWDNNQITIEGNVSSSKTIAWKASPDPRPTTSRGRVLAAWRYAQLGMVNSSWVSTCCERRRFFSAMRFLRIVDEGAGGCGDSGAGPGLDAITGCLGKKAEWAMSEDLSTRFIAYGWNVLRVGDANDVEALTRAFLSFRRESDRPTLIVVDSHIAWGAPTKQDSFHAHGTPLGDKEVTATKHIYNWPDEKFLVPEAVTQHFRDQMARRGGIARKEWEKTLVNYKKQFPEEGRILEDMIAGRLPVAWDQFCKPFPADAKGLATRQSSSECLNFMGKGVPWLMGGSADLATSCLTTLKGMDDFMPPASQWGQYAGRNLHFGIREHAMGSIMNGLALCKLRPFGSTFLVFSDYMRPPIRLASIMEMPCIFIFTHDSIGVGEDGPTHQPVEHVGCLRSIPGLVVFRPCDANECLEMWKYIMPLKDQPVALILSRQALPTLDRQKFAAAEGVHKGGYILADASTNGAPPELILMSTGSEVHLMLQAHEVLAASGVKVRSVSVPSMEIFKQQPQEYIDMVLPNACRARVSIEASRRDSWGSLIGLDGEHVGMITFGLSAPSKKVQIEKGFTVDAVTAAARRVMSGQPRQISSRAEVLKSWKKRKLST